MVPYVRNSIIVLFTVHYIAVSYTTRRGSIVADAIGVDILLTGTGQGAPCLFVSFRPTIEVLFFVSELLAYLAAALGEPAVGEDALLARIHATNATLKPRRTRDDICHALPPPGHSRPGGAGAVLHEREPTVPNRDGSLGSSLHKSELRVTFCA